jgi:hypothetical protein
MSVKVIPNNFSVHISIFYLLRLHVAIHQQQQWNDEKNELILWKLSPIWMKLLNNIELNSKFNWVQIPKLNSNTGIQIQIQFKIQFDSDWIELNSNLKTVANWCIRYWKYACHYTSSNVTIATRIKLQIPSSEHELKEWKYDWLLLNTMVCQSLK